MVTEEQVQDALKTVIDPHTGTSVWEMGLISNVAIEGGKVSLVFTPTSPFCPMGIKLSYDIKKAVADIEGVSDVTVTVHGHMNAAEINDMLKDMK